MEDKQKNYESPKFFDEQQQPVDPRSEGALVYEKDESLVHREIENEVILVPVKQEVGDLSKIYTLNETAAYVWEIIDGKRRVQDIIELMVDRFDVDRETAREDLSEFVAQLTTIGGVKLKT
jgi:hypothetical protein